MLNQKNMVKIATGFLILVLPAFPRLSYADWGVGVGFGGPGYYHDDHGFYRWHDHPHWGVHFHYLPDGYFTIWVGGARYYYYDGLYYSYVGGDYVIVAPPVGAVVTTIPTDFQPVLVNGVTYYADNGTYYLYTAHGYQVAPAPVTVAPAAPPLAGPAVVVTQPAAVQNSFTVNIPNNSGGYTAVVIKRSGNGYVGPQGEFYPEFPKITQLKVMYGK